MRLCCVWRRPAVSMRTTSASAGLRGGDGVVRDRARVGARLWRTKWAPERSAHTASWSMAAARNVSAAPITTLWPSWLSRYGELADGGGLAAAVDPHHEDDGGRVLQRDPRRLGGHVLRDGAPQGGRDVGAAGDAALGGLLAHLLHELERRVHPAVGGDERLLQVVPGLGGHELALVDACELGRDGLARAAQVLAQPAEQAPAARRLLPVGLGRRQPEQLRPCLAVGGVPPVLTRRGHPGSRAARAGRTAAPGPRRRALGGGPRSATRPRRPS